MLFNVSLIVLVLPEMSSPLFSDAKKVKLIRWVHFIQLLYIRPLVL